MLGSSFVSQIRALRGTARDAAVLDRFADHVPWPLRPVRLVDRQGKLRGELRVASDVFAIGEPDDFVRVPVGGAAAQAIADRLGMVLPTSRIAEAVYAAGDVVLAPRPMTPPEFPYDASMLTTARFALHNAWVETARAGRTGLVVGHKKDVVVSRRLGWQPGRVAIYGWFTAPGQPTQPLSLAHEESYADYSHGLRLVAPTARIDGVERRIADVLRDPALCQLLSDEGTVDLATIRYGAPPVLEPTAPGAALPVLRLGSSGPAVTAWQTRLSAAGFDPGPIDGAFGPRTLAATRALQNRYGLTVDGVVGPNTRRVAQSYTGAPPPSPRLPAPPPEKAPSVERFIPAKWFGTVPNRPVDVVVMHTTESPCRAGVAANVANYFAGLDEAHKASAHYVVDPASVIACVREQDVAYAAPGANHSGIHCELTARAAFTDADWQSPEAEAMLRRAAALVAGICRRYGIPARFVDVAGLLRGERGITTHLQVTRAFHESTHTDPGPAWPEASFVARVAALLTEPS